MTEEEKRAAEEAERLAAEEAARLAAEEAEKNKGKNTDQDLINKLVSERVDAELKEIKSKLDNAYSARDAALEKAEKLAKEKRDAEIEALKAAGKHQEALEMQLKEEREKREKLERENTMLNRDSKVRAELSSLKFKNNRAQETAFKEISEQLVRDDQGNWKHRSGISISDFVEAFSKDEENSFLFQVKTNNGSGTTSSRGTTTEQSKSLFAMSQAEVLKLAEQGKLPNQRK